MKKLMKIVTVICCAMMLGCSSTSGSDTGKVEYSMFTGDTKYPTRLTLFESNETFQIVVNNTKESPYGTYTISDDVYTMKTLDGQYIFKFKIVSDGVLNFVAEGSLPVFVDGQEFLRNDLYVEKYGTINSTTGSTGQGTSN